mmetsp:Transcript_13262/g.35256  ORF Transcript_13262/g.35256 Transcript_13262/m.35256 type:complete len:94 (-) Transcript_13262:97-378(-)
MNKLLLEVSGRFVYTKFMKCKATDAIKNYPDEKCPTLLVYHGGKVVMQYVGLEAFDGARTTADDIEWKLSLCKAVESEMDEPPQKKKFNMTRV